MIKLEEVHGATHKDCLFVYQGAGEVGLAMKRRDYGGEDEDEGDVTIYTASTSAELAALVLHAGEVFRSLRLIADGPCSCDEDWGGPTCAACEASRVLEILVQS